MGILTWVILFTLIAVNALYVAAEFAAVSVRRSRIQQEAENGNWLARRLLPVLTDPHRLDDYIAACQIGITISSLVAGAFGQARLATALTPLLSRFGDLQVATAQSVAAVIVLIGLTAFQMILGELVPKSVALRLPTKTALYTVVPMRWSVRGLRWFIRVLNGSGAAILGAFGIRAVGHGHIHSPEEIDYLIGESRDGGVLAPEESRRLRHALRLSARLASTIMVARTRIEAVDVDATAEEARELLNETPYTRLPVYEESIDRIIGLVHARDLVLFVARGAEGEARATSVGSIMRPILVVPDSIKADRLLASMRAERRTMAVLVDEFGGTAGIVTIGDILDELIGEVADEFRDVTRGPEQLADGRIRLPGSLALVQAREWLGMDRASDSHTIAGLILDHLGRLPAVGETVVIDGVRFEVERLSKRAITSVLVTVPSPGDEDDG